jgi:hypothetical protein
MAWRRRAAIGATLAVAVAAACTLANPLDRYGPGLGPTGDAALPSRGTADGAIDSGPSWKRYALRFSAMRWDPPALLTDLWNAPNAPPPRGIVTAVQLIDVERLIVFADDGNVYVQSGATWRPPVPITRAWAPLRGPPAAAFHVPFAFIKTVAPDASDVEGITLLDSPNAFNFSYTHDDHVLFVESRPLTKEDGGPPVDVRASWSFEYLDLENADPAQHYKNYTLYQNGTLYEFWADFSYHSVAVTESPMFENQPNAPVPSTVAAAYFDQAGGIAYFIGP